jgi:hypothetical protein
MKYVAGTLREDEIWRLLVDDDIRTFICSFGPKYAYWYADKVDIHPRDDTREAACKDSQYACCYALAVDGCPRDDTREAACKDSCYAYWYAKEIDKCPGKDTREAAYKNKEWKQEYINFEIEYNEQHRKN